jgi:hypothetical protein
MSGKASQPQVSVTIRGTSLINIPVAQVKIEQFEREPKFQPISLEIGMRYPLTVKDYHVEIDLLPGVILHGSLGVLSPEGVLERIHPFGPMGPRPQRKVKRRRGKR